MRHRVTKSNPFIDMLKTMDLEDLKEILDEDQLKHISTYKEQDKRGSEDRDDILMTVAALRKKVNSAKASAARTKKDKDPFKGRKFPDKMPVSHRDWTLREL